MEKGNDIISNYQLIIELQSKFVKIYPNEIKFIVQYGIFIKQVINNDQEAIIQLEKATEIYNRLLLLG